MPFSSYAGLFEPDDLVVLKAAFDEAWLLVQEQQGLRLPEADAKARLSQLIVQRAQSSPYDKDELVRYAVAAITRAPMVTAFGNGTMGPLDPELQEKRSNPSGGFSLGQRYGQSSG